MTLPGGLTLTSGDGSVTEFRASEDGVINLGAGANMNGAADPFDVGVEIGTAGIGHDDWQAVGFVLSADQALSLDLIASQLFGVRLASVGEEDGARTGGLKLVGTAPDAPAGNRPPVAVDDTATTDEDTAITLEVLGNDSDPDLDPLTLSPGSWTSSLGATVTVNGDGSILYDPRTSAVLNGLNTGDEPLTDRFSYTVTDGKGGTSTAWVDVTVNGVTDGPVDGFDGKTVNYAYEYRPAAGTGFTFARDVLVGDAVEVPQMTNGGAFEVASLDIANTRLIIDYVADGFWLGDGFNGFRISDTDGVLAEITGVTIAESNMAGFGASNIAFDANGITVDWGGLAFTADTRVVLDVAFA